MTRKYKFTVDVGFVNATREEVVEIEFDGDEVEEQIEKIVQDAYESWVWEKVDGGWEEVI